MSISAWSQSKWFLSWLSSQVDSHTISATPSLGPNLTTICYLRYSRAKSAKLWSDVSFKNENKWNRGLKQVTLVLRFAHTSPRPMTHIKKTLTIATYCMHRRIFCVYFFVVILREETRRKETSLETHRSPGFLWSSFGAPVVTRNQGHKTRAENARRVWCSLQQLPGHTSNNRFGFTEREHMPALLVDQHGAE